MLVALRTRGMAQDQMSHGEPRVMEELLIVELAKGP
jgi:hypothetical protein